MIPVDMIPTMTPEVLRMLAEMKSPPPDSRLPTLADLEQKRRALERELAWVRLAVREALGRSP